MSVHVTASHSSYDSASFDVHRSKVYAMIASENSNKSSLFGDFVLFVGCWPPCDLWNEITVTRI